MQLGTPCEGVSRKGDWTVYDCAEEHVRTLVLKKEKDLAMRKNFPRMPFQIKVVWKVVKVGNASVAWTKGSKGSCLKTVEKLAAVRRKGRNRVDMEDLENQIWKISVIRYSIEIVDGKADI